MTAPKTKAGVRRVPLAPHVVTMLRRRKLASRFSTETDLVFASKTGRPLGHRNGPRRGFEAARDRAGLDSSLSFHDLRHAFASMAAHLNVPLTVLSEVLGHADTNVTRKVYMHLVQPRAGRGRVQGGDGRRWLMPCVA